MWLGEPLEYTGRGVVALELSEVRGQPGAQSDLAEEVEGGQWGRGRERSWTGAGPKGERFTQSQGGDSLDLRFRKMEVLPGDRDTQRAAAEAPPTAPGSRPLTRSWQPPLPARQGSMGLHT